MKKLLLMILALRTATFILGSCTIGGVGGGGNDDGKDSGGNSDGDNCGDNDNGNGGEECDHKFVFSPKDSATCLNKGTEVGVCSLCKETT